MGRRALTTAVGVIATVALYMAPAAATSEPVTKIHLKLDSSSVPAGSDVSGLVEVTTGSGKAEVPFAGAALTVWIDGVQVGSAVTNGAGVAAVGYPMTARGPHTIRVAFEGDANHKKAHKEREFVVTPGEPGQTKPPDPTTTPPPDPTTPPPDPTTTTPPPDPTTPPPDPTTTTPPPDPDPTTTVPPPVGQAPDAPVIYLYETPAAGGLNYLEWTVPADNGSEITGYNVYRRAPGGTMDFLLHKGPQAFSADDTHITSGVTYAYVVTAVNAVGESVWSNEVSLTAI
jgi:fibronectin type III domain protein